MTEVFIVYGYNTLNTNRAIYGFYPSEELARTRMNNIPVEDKLDNINFFRIPYSDQNGADFTFKMICESQSIPQ